LDSLQRKALKKKKKKKKKKKEKNKNTPKKGEASKASGKCSFQKRAATAGWEKKEVPKNQNHQEWTGEGCGILEEG